MYKRQLKALGFAHCWDTEFAADATIWEEASEFVERLAARRDLPQFTSCCPGWQKSVSYTHLDVYKRQRPGSGESFAGPGRVMGPLCRHG